MRRPRSTHGKRVASRRDHIIICKKFCNAKTFKVSTIVDGGNLYRFVKSWANNEQAEKLRTFYVI